ncbi:hypothetical protein EV130_106120 [Rhizobium azibense]|uniref:Uncharacterized protein n=1 Tax=Rhizobium azibense TaxID=1136135 RepID=A0A4R3QTP0_9HYPH|nr:hypothetical protein EV130_106120 [Rhizobium azibense]
MIDAVAATRARTAFCQDCRTPDYLSPPAPAKPEVLRLCKVIDMSTGAFSCRQTRMADGLVPNFALKLAAKCAGVENPQAAAISVILTLPARTIS